MLKKLLIITSLFFAFVLNGCGGSNSGDSKLPTEPSKSQKATLTEANSEKVALSTFNAIGILKDTDTDDFYYRNAGELGKSLKILSKDIKSISPKVIASDYSSSCSNGGSVYVDEISDDEVNVEYQDCEIDGTTYDGKLNVVAINDSYVKVTFEDFTVIDSTQKLEIEYAIFKIDSSVNSIKIEKLYATQKKDGHTTEFLNYYTNYVYSDFENIITLTFHGWVKTECSDGYVYLESTSVLSYDNDADEIKGSYEISSKDETIQVIFDYDEVTIIDTKGDSETIPLSEYQDRLDLECD